MTGSGSIEMCCDGKKSPPSLSVSALELNGSCGEARQEETAVRGRTILLLLLAVRGYTTPLIPLARGGCTGSSPKVTPTLPSQSHRASVGEMGTAWGLGQATTQALAHSRCSTYAVK